MSKVNELKELEDLGKPIYVNKPGLTEVEKEIFKVDEAVLGPVHEDKPKPVKEKELPDHIRKATITINDKDKNNSIVIKFQGDWVPSDINLAGKYLILDFHEYVRNRAIGNK